MCKLKCELEAQLIAYVTSQHCDVEIRPVKMPNTCDRNIMLLTYRRAGLTTVPVVPWEGAPAARGPPTNCNFFLPRCFAIDVKTTK